MKNTTLLKVLSATAIFSAIAAIEAYDQDNFAFAAETPVVASNSTSTTGANPATTTAAPTATTTPATATPAPVTPKAEEPATVAQDVKALPDGEYNITAKAWNFYRNNTPSMADAAIDNTKTKLVVNKGNYTVNVTFKPIDINGTKGYLGNLKYYDGDKNHSNYKTIDDNEFKDATIVENYPESSNDSYFSVLKNKEEFKNRTVYPKTFSFSVDKNKIDANNQLETYHQVFVPAMEKNSEGSGTQNMRLVFDLTSLSRKKVTADNYEAATYKNPNKDVEYKGTINKPFPIHVQGHLRNANNNDEESLYGSALDSYVKVEKVGDKYKYTLRFKKGLADVGGEFYPFELHKVAYEGKDIPLTTLATNGNSSIKEGSITTDKLLEKIQLDGTAPYPNGALMSHFVTLKLYYETATSYTERPAKIEEVVVPAKPKPVTPTPPKPKEEPKPAAPTVPDHVVTADKVPTTFPTTVKGELNGRTTGTSSIYENAFVKDVKVEKVGDKYQYTIQVKEGNSNTYLLRKKPFTVSKLTYKGTEINFTEVDAATKLKEGKILTDSLLDKIQVDAVISVQTKGGAKPRYEERNADSTITLDFPTVEKVKEEAANNLVPAKINNAHVTNKSSMADGALVHEKTRVEKVNDTYHYYLTFKDLNIGAQAGTVEKLTVDGTVAERTDLGGSAHEKVFHFTSPEKLTEKTITFSVNVGGVPLVGHSNVPATLKFNWDAATSLTDDQVTALHKEETAKAQAEKEKLEREKAEEPAAGTTPKAEEPAAGTTPKAEEPAAGTTPKAEEPAAGTTPKAEEPAAGTTPKAEEPAGTTPKAEEPAAGTTPKAEEPATGTTPKAEEPTAGTTPKAEEPAAGTTPKAEEPAAGTTPKAEEPAAGTTPKAEEPAAGTTPKAEEPTAGTTPKAEADRLKKERLEKEAAAKAEKERLEKEAEAAEKTVTKLKDDKAQLEKLVKEKEEAINNATTEAEKEKLTTEKAKVEKELTKKVTELKVENEKVVNLKFEAVKNQAVENIVKDRSLSDKKAKQLEAIVKTASLKDTLVAKLVENGSSEKVTVTFDNNPAINAHHLVVQKANEKTVADVKEKVEELAKKADKNLSVVKTIDLHFADSNGKEIKKQGGTRAVTVAVVASEGEKLEVYYVRETDDKNIVLEKVPSVYKDGNLTFFTNHFSRYTIVKVGKTVASNQDTPVPVAPSTDSTKPVVTDKNEALTQPELPALDSEKTVSQNTSQTVAKGLKQLAKTGLNTTATAGLGVLALLSALVLRRKNNK